MDKIVNSEINYISEETKKRLVSSLLKNEPILSIVNKISEFGGRALLVGGAVRDLLLEIEIKDLDIEIYGLSPEKLEMVLRNFGPVGMVGKSFGVFRVNGLDIDFSLPRRDSAGRKPTVMIDQNMPLNEAFSRRDLTINAMGIDLITFQLIDPFGGQKHLEASVLACPDKEKFTEDPLRFYRVMQFIGRFGMQPDTELNDICSHMDISQVSIERISVEFEKLLLKSRRPSLGIRWLKDIGRLKEILPEVYATVGVKQEPKWHPEGDVFEHSMQCLDAAASFDYFLDCEDSFYEKRRQDGILQNNKHCAESFGDKSKECERECEQDFDLKENFCDRAFLMKKLIVLYACFLHDLGKAIDTQVVDGKIKSIGHEKSGAKLARRLLSRITKNKELADSVYKLVKYHMAPCQLVDCNSKISAYKRLAKKLYPEVTIDMLAKVCLADKLGRNSKGHEPLTGNDETIEKFLKIAKEAQVEYRPEAPVLMGRDLLGQITPGPQMGDMLKKAYEIQIEQGIKDKEILKSLVIKDL